ncbi:hypothetical protein [Methanohalophilus sp.]
MNYRCRLCEGKMNRWRYPALKRHDQFGRNLVVTGVFNVEMYPDL